MLHSRTKKVITYGKQKTRVVNVLQGFNEALASSQLPSILAPPPTPRIPKLLIKQRPPLLSKPSQTLASADPDPSSSTPAKKTTKPRTYGKTSKPRPSPLRLVNNAKQPRAPVSASSITSSSSAASSIFIPLRALPTRGTGDRKRVIESPETELEEAEEEDPDWQMEESAEEEEEFVPVKRKMAGRGRRQVKSPDSTFEEEEVVAVWKTPGKSRGRMVVSSPAQETSGESSVLTELPTMYREDSGVRRKVGGKGRGGRGLNMSGESSMLTELPTRYRDEEEEQEEDDELAAALGGLNLSKTKSSKSKSITSLTLGPQTPLESLLETCVLSSPLDFQTFLDTHSFPALPPSSSTNRTLFPPPPATKPTRTRSKPAASKPKPQPQTQARRFQKVGEASFSEVFSVEGVVMKVVPLREGDAQEEGEGVIWMSGLEDVRREIEITKRMSGVAGGFVSYYGAFVVQGSYPEVLLDEWDRFDSEHGSDSLRPDSLTSDQLFAVILLANGGSDLEHFQFSKVTGWRQAMGVVGQVVKALAVGERVGEFEHRDLHEGQVLIKPTNTSIPPSHSASPSSPSFCGLETSIIDFGLSRVSMPSGEVYWTPIPEDVYDGEGEQWDVYRRMRGLVEGKGDGDWEGFYGESNVYWIHHLLRIILHHTPSLHAPKSKLLTQTLSRRDPSRSPLKGVKGARSMPSAAKKSEIEEMEVECWRWLQEMERVLGLAVGFGSGGARKSGGRTRAKKVGKREEGVLISFMGARDVESWAEESGWRV